MAKCEFCGKRVASLEMYTDEFGDTFNICEDCKKNAIEGKCRKCGRDLGQAAIKGLCLDCGQAEKHAEERKKEEVLAGLNLEDTDTGEYCGSDVVLTDDDLEHYQMINRQFGPSDIQKSRVLKYIWIKTKLNAAGIFDNDRIMEYSPCVDTILGRSMSRLIDHRCRLVFFTSAQKLSEIADDEVIIDTENNVAIVAKKETSKEARRQAKK